MDWYCAEYEDETLYEIHRRQRKSLDSRSWTTL